MKNIQNETYINLEKLENFISNYQTSDFENINQMIENNKSLNSSKIKNYNKILLEIANNIEKIGLPDNSISYSYVLFYFLHTGYLSKGKFNKKKNNKYKDVIGYLGLDVINGEACCRHVASLHEDVFKNIGVLGKIISTSTNNINDEFTLKANHAINILKYNDVYYAHDILNGVFYYFETPVILKSPDKTVPVELQYQMYQPIEDIKLWGRTPEETVNLLTEIKNTNKEKILDTKELNEIIEATKVRFFGSFKELEKYKKRTKVLFWKISSKIFK